MGLWVLETHYAVDHQGWIRAAHYDEHVSCHVMVFIWDFVLVEGKDF